MNLLAVFSFINAFIPICIIIGIVIRYRYTNRLGTLTLVPSLLFLTFYYTAFLIATHISTIDPEVWRVPFRLGLSLLLVSLLIHVTVDILSLRKIRDYQREIEEK